MLYGALVCLAGIAATVATFILAPPDGVVIIAWGAMLAGAVQFFRGVYQFGKMR
jgi:hypothetical protein